VLIADDSAQPPAVNASLLRGEARRRGTRIRSIGSTTSTSRAPFSAGGGDQSLEQIEILTEMARAEVVLAHALTIAAFSSRSRIGSATR
jgi:hypothetical protein